MAKYVPPSRRAGYAPPTPADVPPSHINPRASARTAKGSDQARLYSLSELSRCFTHPQDSTPTFFSYPLPYTPRRSKPPYDPTRRPERTPFPPSPPPPPPRHPLEAILSYVVIFNQAHPAWEKDRELWTHTNADKMIADWEGEKRNFGRPVPVFKAHRTRRFENTSEGWWQIDSLEVVQPKSDELRRMLEAKEAGRSYTAGGRAASAWEHSLAQTWVKLHLVPCPPSGAHYTELKHPMELKGGLEGEIERYLLELGGLTEELETLGNGRGGDAGGQGGSENSLGLTRAEAQDKEVSAEAGAA